MNAAELKRMWVLTALLHAGVPLFERDARWLCDVLTPMLLTRERLSRRDELLRQLGGLLAPDASASTRADAVRVELRRYRAVWNTSDQYRNDPKADYSGKPKGLLFQLHKLTDGQLPDSHRQLRRILST